MYAVIETGGKQYRVEVGTELEVELLDVEPGEDDHSRARPARRRRRRVRDRTPIVADAAVERRGRPAGPRREAHLVQVPAQGPQPGQEGPSPGADGPPHQPTSGSEGKSAAEAEAQGRGGCEDRAPAPRGGRRQAGRRGRRARREARGSKAPTDAKAAGTKTTPRPTAAEDRAKADAKAPAKATGQGDDGQGDPPARRPRPKKPPTTPRPAAKEAGRPSPRTKKDE